MADPITLQQLEDAQTDALTLASVVNGDANTVVTSRLGGSYPSISNAIARLTAPAYSTWITLSAAALAQNAGAEVLSSDGGNHTDPITGLNVPNSGYFRAVVGTAGNPSGWTYVGPSQTDRAAASAILARNYSMGTADVDVPGGQAGDRPAQFWSTKAAATLGAVQAYAAAAAAAAAALVPGGGSIQFPRFGNLSDQPAPANDNSFVLPANPTQDQTDAYNAAIAIPRIGPRGLAILPNAPRLAFANQMRMHIPVEIPWGAMTNGNKVYRVCGTDVSGNYNWSIRFFSPRYAQNGWRQNRRRFWLNVGYLGAGMVVMSQQVPETWRKVACEPVINAAGRLGIDVVNLDTGVVLSGFGADPGGGYATSSSNIVAPGGELSINVAGKTLIGSGATWTAFTAATTMLAFGGAFGADANVNQWQTPEGLGGGYWPGSIGACRVVEGPYDDPASWASVRQGASVYSIAAAAANVKLDLTLTLNPNDAVGTVGGVPLANGYYTTGNVAPGSTLCAPSTTGAAATTYAKIVADRRVAYTHGVPAIRGHNGEMWGIQKERRCTYNVVAYQPDDGTFNGGNVIECRVITNDGTVLVKTHEAGYFKFSASSIPGGTTVQIHPVIPMTRGGCIIQTRIKGTTTWWSHSGDRVGLKVPGLGQSQENNNTVQANEHRILRQSSSEVLFVQCDANDPNIQDAALAVSAATIRGYYLNPAAVGSEYDKLRTAISDTQSGGATSSASRADLRRPTLYNLKNVRYLEHIQDMAEELLRNFDYDIEIGLQANTNQGAMSVIADWYLSDPLVGNNDVGPGQWQQTMDLAAFMGTDITGVRLDWWTDQIGYGTQAGAKFMDGFMFGKGPFVYRTNSVPVFIPNTYHTDGYTPLTAWNNYWVPVANDPGYGPNDVWTNYWDAAGVTRCFMQLFDAGSPVFIQPMTRHNIAGAWFDFDQGYNVGETRDSIELWRVQNGMPRGPEPGDVKLIDQFHPQDDHEKIGRTRFGRYCAHTILWSLNLIAHPPSWMRPDPNSFAPLDADGAGSFSKFKFTIAVSADWLLIDGLGRDWRSVDGSGNPLSDVTASVAVSLVQPTAVAGSTSGSPLQQYIRTGLKAWISGANEVTVQKLSGRWPSTAYAAVLMGGPMGWGIVDGTVKGYVASGVLTVTDASLVKSGMGVGQTFTTASTLFTINAANPDGTFAVTPNNVNSGTSAAPFSASISGLALAEAKLKATTQWLKVKWSGVRDDNGVCVNAASTQYKIAA